MKIILSYSINVSLNQGIRIILIVNNFMQSMFQKAQVGSQGSPISQLGQTVERRREGECLGQRVGTSMYKHTWFSAEVCWVRSGGPGDLRVSAEHCNLFVYTNILYSPLWLNFTLSTICQPHHITVSMWLRNIGLIRLVLT